MDNDNNLLNALLDLSRDAMLAADGEGRVLRATKHSGR